MADSLEAEWNEKLRALSKAQDDYERKCCDDRKLLDQTRQGKLLSLSKSFPVIWDDPKTPHRERKRMVALLIEDVTLLKKEQIMIQVRFRAGATTTVKIPLPLNAWQGRKTAEHVLSKMDELLNKYTDSEVAQRLNRLGMKTGAGEKFTTQSVRWARYANGLKSYPQRLKAAGMLTTKQVAEKFNVSDTTVKNWRKKGQIQGCVCDDKGQWLYYSPSSFQIDIDIRI